MSSLNKVLLIGNLGRDPEFRGADRQEAQIAEQMSPYTGTLQALAVAEATRTAANKWDGKVPSTVSLWWLPSSITDFVTKMFGSQK